MNAEAWPNGTSDRAAAASAACADEPCMTLLQSPSACSDVPDVSTMLLLDRGCLLLPDSKPLLHPADMTSRPIRTAALGHARNGPPAAREFSGTRRANRGVAVSSGRLSTRQRVNGAYCQSMPRALRNARAASSSLSPGTSRTDTVPLTVAARCRSLVSNTRSSCGAARSEDAVGKTAMRNNRVVTSGPQPSAETAQHFVAHKVQFSAGTWFGVVVDH